LAVQRGNAGPASPASTAPARLHQLGQAPPGRSSRSCRGWPACATRSRRTCEIPHGRRRIRAAIRDCARTPQPL